MSKRKEIREKIKALLTNKTACGVNVFENRLLKWRKEKFPAISIYTQSESSEIKNVSPRLYKRRLSLAIEIIAMADNNIDDYMDVLADQVEAILHQTWNLEGVAENFIYLGTQIGIAHDGADSFACAKLEYEAQYSSIHAVAPESLPDLLKISNTIKSGENEIVSEINFPAPEEDQSNE